MIDCNSITPPKWFFTYIKFTQEETVDGNDIPNVKMGEDNKKIYIERATRENQGEYECSGFNHKNERFFAISTVTVIGKSLQFHKYITMCNLMLTKHNIRTVVLLTLH